jgi:uncharacterized protein YkwD
MTRLFIILISSFIINSCEDSDSLFGPPSDIKDNIYDHINHFRLMNGVSVLELNSDLNRLADEHAFYMSQNSVVNHNNQAVRYNFVIEELSMSKYAEIVEAGDLYGRDLINKWSDNEEVVLMLIGDYKYIGLGVYEGGDQSYATIIFTK